MQLTQLRISRREALSSAAVAGFSAALLPGLAFADPDMVAAELKKLFGDKKFAASKIKLDIPEIAENGLVVPLTIEVESPMTESDYVAAVHVFADGNPLPNVITWRFTPACGKAAASTRMRLAQTQNVVCVAEMSTGALHSARAQIKVTVGGCGG